MRVAGLAQPDFLNHAGFLLNDRFLAVFSYYNEKSPHSSHGLLTPAEAYDAANQNLKAAA